MSIQKEPQPSPDPVPHQGPARGPVHRLFLTPDELRPPDGYRLRLLWRLGGWIALTVLIGSLVTVAYQLAASSAGGPLNDPAFSQMFASAATVVIFTLSIFLARRWLDRRSFTSLGLSWDPGALRDLLAGILVAAIMMLLIFVIERAGGWLVMTGFAWDVARPGQWLASLGLYWIAFVGVGWHEELFFRGYLLQNLADGWPWGARRVKLIVSAVLISILFGLAHLGNPNATLIGGLGTGLAGVFMAYALFASRRLWLPIGLHIGWNFVEGPVLGFPVSGLGGYISLVQQETGGPEWITGGAFGPEAGLVLLPALALGAFLVWWYTRAGGSKAAL